MIFQVGGGCCKSGNAEIAERARGAFLVCFGEKEEAVCKRDSWRLDGVS